VVPELQEFIPQFKSLCKMAPYLNSREISENGLTPSEIKVFMQNMGSVQNRILWSLGWGDTGKELENHLVKG